MLHDYTNTTADSVRAAVSDALADADVLIERTVASVDAPSFDGEVHPDLVKDELVRIGGILLIIGVLHGLNLVIMPVLGRLFSLNRRLPPPDPRDGRYE